MARAAGINVENAFTRGLVTEATGLNFPENACTETYDCVFDQTGKVTRRLGFNYEPAYEKEEEVRIDNRVITEFRWKNVAADGNTSFVVTQIGNRLRFYEEDQDSALSKGRKSFTVNLTDYATSGNDKVVRNTCQFASGSGYLFVSHPFLEPIYIQYNPDNDTITVREINIKIRDFDGISDGTSPGQRPSSLSNEHKYNLYNQSWYGESNVVGSGDLVRNPLEEWELKRDDFPSNSDVWWYYKDATDRFDTRNVERFELGNTRAPRGHYILEAFNQDRSAVSGISGIPRVTANDNRPSCVAFFAGRVWYAGVNAQDFNTNVYFSQIATTRGQFARCYQDQDPTSEILHDLLPTDGGVITIPEIGNVITMIPIQSALVLFATNGIWSITGSQGIGFTANDYSVTKISSVSSISHLSFVDVKGFPIWWNGFGIYTVAGADQLANLEVKNLTEQTIKTFYGDIPLESKIYAKGAYHEKDNVVRWVYRSSAWNIFQNRYTYNRVLTLNLNTGSFSPWRISAYRDIYVCGIVTSAGKTTTTVQENVTDKDENNVTDGGLDNVYVETKQRISSDEDFKYYTYKRRNDSDYGDFTWSNCDNPLYLDWTREQGGTSYKSYFITGYKIHGDAAKDFQSNYVWVYVEDVTGGSCYFQGIRDFTTSASTGKYSSKQQVYNTMTSRRYKYRKLKVRGQGKAMQLHFESEQGKPFSIIGFSIFETSPEIP